MGIQKSISGKIKGYWEKFPPQVWYSNKDFGSLGWFNEIEYKRYSTYYPYIPEIAEFENHRGEKVLAIGFGIGTDLIQYAKNGSKIYGIELSKNSIEITKNNLKLLGLKAKLKHGSAEKLPFKSNFFDLVYSFGVLHHIPNVEKVVSEIYRVLKPKGKAIIMLYAWGWKHLIKRLFIKGILCGNLRLGYHGCVCKNTEVHGNCPYTVVYRKKNVKKLFSRFGCVDIKKYRLGEYFDYAPYNSWKFPQVVTNILYLLKVERLIGENWIIKAVKTKERKKSSFWKTLFGS